MKTRLAVLVALVASLLQVAPLGAARAADNLVITVIPVTEANPVGSWAGFQVFARDTSGDPLSGTLTWGTANGSANVAGGLVSVSNGWGGFGYTGTVAGQDQVLVFDGSSGSTDEQRGTAVRVWYESDTNVASTTPARIIFDDPYYDTPVDYKVHYHGFGVYNAAGERVTNSGLMWTAVIAGAHGTRTITGLLDSTGYGVFGYQAQRSGWDEIVVTVGAVQGSAARSYGLTSIDLDDTAPLPPPVPKIGAYCDAGQIMTLNANVKQFQLDATRLDHFGDRVKALSVKRSVDGMGCIPDAILLQEIYNDVTFDAVAAINLDLSGNEWSPFALAKDFPRPSAPSGGKYIVGDTAILWNKHRLDRLGTGEIATTYDSSDRCNDSLTRDVDLDGVADCSVVKTKLNATALFEEKLYETQKSTDPVRIGLVSVHLVPNNFLKDDTTAERKKTEWGTQLGTEVLLNHPGAVSYALGGDFNRGRCLPGTMVPDDGTYKETTVCGSRLWWDNLQMQEFLDTIYAVHGATNASLDAQYEFGPAGDVTKRIDFIFARGANVLTAASMDRSCGVATGTSCKDKTGPEYYSDHRLMWALLGPVPRPPDYETM